jgi:hypothetical protein
MPQYLIAAALATIAVIATPATASAHLCANGDPAVRASSQTSCAFAGRIASRVYSGPVLRRGHRRTIQVRSPVTHKRYRIRLVRRGNYVTGTGRRGIWVRFYYDGS